MTPQDAADARARITFTTSTPFNAAVASTYPTQFTQNVGDPIVLTLDDPKLWEHPWIYIVEPGNLKITYASDL